jgi:hypothetical protein
MRDLWSVRLCPICFSSVSMMILSVADCRSSVGSNFRKEDFTTSQEAMFPKAVIYGYCKDLCMNECAAIRFRFFFPPPEYQQVPERSFVPIEMARGWIPIV